jgi:tetratricopeptide (TPR) repeat protein
VALVSGEPGIGKSRLAAALSQRIESEPHTRLRYFCAPHHHDSALHPFIIQLERAAGFARDDTVEQKLGKVQRLLAPAAQGDDEIELLAELLSLPSAAAELGLSPQRKREKLLEALLHQLEGLARSRPVLMVFEDTHWVDPTSRELLDLTVARVAHIPALLVITFRPEFQHGWGGEPHVTSLSLNRLAGRDGVQLVERLLGNAGLSHETVDEIVERADGVPLFVEELAKAVLETSDRVLAASGLPEVMIPPTLHASLIARLDRLGPTAKEVAQVGSVIGREFGYELIEQVAQQHVGQLRSGLDRLAEAGLLFCRGATPNSSYMFKHALVQDAAYSTLLRSRRHELHARIAAVLERDFADVVERQPELLAHHLTAAGDGEHAVDQWLKAGRYAAQRLAHFEAIGNFERGLAVLSELPGGSVRDQREIELQLARGLSVLTTEGFASPKALEIYGRARELAERRGDRRQLFMAEFGLWQTANGRGGMVECRKYSDRLQQLTVGDADEELRLQAHHSAWTTGLFSGEPAAAHEHCGLGRLLYDPERHRHHRLLYGGHDPGVCALYMGAQAYWLLGQPDTGLATGREALALAEDIAHPFSLGTALIMNAMLHLDRDEPEASLRRIEAAEALAAEQRLGLAIEPEILRGAVMTAQGASTEAVASLREALTRPRALRLRPYGMARLGEALAQQGEYGAALIALREGLADQERTGQRRWEAELYRLEGLALARLNRPEEADNALKEALRVARRQQAKSYELRAAASLARLWAERGQRTAARELLAPVYSWFTEGFDTADLKEAKGLLDDLA